MTANEFINLFDNGHLFTEEQLCNFFYDDLIDDDIEFCDEEIGECRRWSHFDTRVYKINNRYFAFYGDIGSTEMQDSYFDCQPEEVEPFEVTVTAYRPLSTERSN